MRTAVTAWRTAAGELRATILGSMEALDLPYMERCNGARDLLQRVGAHARWNVAVAVSGSRSQFTRGITCLTTARTSQQQWPLHS